MDRDRGVLPCDRGGRLSLPGLRGGLSGLGDPTQGRQPPRRHHRLHDRRPAGDLEPRQDLRREHGGGESDVVGHVVRRHHAQRPEPPGLSRCGRRHGYGQLGLHGPYRGRLDAVRRRQLARRSLRRDPVQPGSRVSPPGGAGPGSSGRRRSGHPAAAPSSAKPSILPSASQASKSRSPGYSARSAAMSAP
jgi:hypothetical protein